MQTNSSTTSIGMVQPTSTATAMARGNSIEIGAPTNGMKRSTTPMRPHNSALGTPMT